MKSERKKFQDSFPFLSLLKCRVPRLLSASEFLKEVVGIRSQVNNNSIQFNSLFIYVITQQPKGLL